MLDTIPCPLFGRILQAIPAPAIRVQPLIIIVAKGELHFPGLRMPGTAVLSIDRAGRSRALFVFSHS